MQLMRTSRSITAALLAGYGILDIKHASSYSKRTSLAAVKRSIALFARYGMRILAATTTQVDQAASGREVRPLQAAVVTALQQ